MGLTVHEAENAFARAMVDDGVLSNDDVHVVLEEKRQTIRKSGLLEFVHADIDLDDVGGLQNLKRWLDKRNNSWMAEAADYGLPAPKGLLMTGVPGCGKSLTAKAIASAWGLPLLRLDIGKVFAGLVGSSEQNMRTAIRTAEATAPCVLWIDEIEKGFSGAAGGGGDSGHLDPSLRLVPHLDAGEDPPVFVIATANNVAACRRSSCARAASTRSSSSTCPPAPNAATSGSSTSASGCTTRTCQPESTSPTTSSARLADATEGYAGAEIEQAVVAGLFDAFAERRPLAEDDLFRAVDNMVPLSVTQAEQIAAIRAWAATRAIAATAAEDRSGYEDDRRTRPDLPIPATHAPGPDAPTRRPRRSRTRRKAGRLLMSIEIVLIPLAIAAISAWKAKTVRRRSRTASRCRRHPHARRTPPDTGTCRHRSASRRLTGTCITARWGDSEGRFTKDAHGIWSVHFAGDPDP